MPINSQEMLIDLEEQVLDHLIGQQLVLHKAEEEGYEISENADETVNQFLEDNMGDISVSEEEVREVYDEMAEQGGMGAGMEFEEIGPQIEEMLIDQEASEEAARVIEELKTGSEIEILYN